MKKVHVNLVVDAFVAVELEVPDDATEDQIIELAYKKADKSDMQFGDWAVGKEEIEEE